MSTSAQLVAFLLRVGGAAETPPTAPGTVKNPPLVVVTTGGMAGGLPCEVADEPRSRDADNSRVWKSCCCLSLSRLELCVSIKRNI